MKLAAWVPGCVCALALFTTASTAGCRHEAPAAHDGGAASVGEAPAPLPEPGPSSQPAAAAPAESGPPDAGNARDGGSAPAASTASSDAATAPAGSGAAPREAGAAAVGVRSTYDRILAKPKDPAATPESLTALVEKATGAKVVVARRSAVHWVLFQLAPTEKGRSADDQQKAVAALQATGAFSAVEGDRLMKVK